MEESQNNSKQTRLQIFYDQLRSNFFNIMFELLKEKTTSKCQVIIREWGCPQLLIIVSLFGGGNFNSQFLFYES